MESSNAQSPDNAPQGVAGTSGIGSASQLPSPSSAGTVPVLGNDDNPIIAADDDVVEQEWVRKAKRIVNQTKNDPYLQEREISKLQADYIKKRYGKEVKLAAD